MSFVNWKTWATSQYFIVFSVAFLMVCISRSYFCCTVECIRVLRFWLPKRLSRLVLYCCRNSCELKSSLKLKFLHFRIFLSLLIRFIQSVALTSLWSELNLKLFSTSRLEKYLFYVFGQYVIYFIYVLPSLVPSRSISCLASCKRKC